MNFGVFYTTTTSINKSRMDPISIDQGGSASTDRTELDDEDDGLAVVDDGQVYHQIGQRCWRSNVFSIELSVG